jgi:C4-dicarboxylate-specific signal transduction histidine kinase
MAKPAFTLGATPSMSDPEKLTSPLSKLSAQQLQDFVITLDRACQGHSVFRGLAHDLSNISHVLSIGSYAEEGEAIEPEKWLSMTRWMEEKLNRAIEILRDFGTPIDAEEQSVIVEEILTAVHQWQPLQRVQSEIPVQLHVAEELAPVRASPGRLRQIVLSLIANAKEAMGGQGGAEIQLTATPSADGVMIVVEDEGSGIDDDIKDRICDAFFTTKNPESHIGLGLTVARAAVESWGGSLSIDAGNDCGTRVGLWLPSWER